MRELDKFRKAVAEAVGTFLIVLFGCGAVMVAERFPGAVPVGGVPIVFGLAVSVMIYALGHISGAHFNPAVTIAFAVARHFPRRDVPFYLFAQFAGATLAVLVLSRILPAGVAYGTTIPAIATLPALAWEGLLTFLLMFVIMAVATDTRAMGTMAGLAIGASVTLAAMVGGPLTGASMNPARSFGPALVSGDFRGFWIYLLGPLSGAIIAALFYEWVRCDHGPRVKNAKGCC